MRAIAETRDERGISSILIRTYFVHTCFVGVGVEGIPMLRFEATHPSRRQHAGEQMCVITEYLPAVLIRMRIELMKCSDPAAPTLHARS